MNDVVGEAGMWFENPGLFQGGDKQWGDGERELVAQGIVDLGHKIGGLARIKELTGGNIALRRSAVDTGASSYGATNDNRNLLGVRTITLFDLAFNKKYPMLVLSTAVHEIGHAIDFQNGRSYATNAPYHAVDNSVRDATEGWAQAVACWVYGPACTDGTYDQYVGLTVSQEGWIMGMLNGWGPCTKRDCTKP